MVYTREWRKYAILMISSALETLITMSNDSLLVEETMIFQACIKLSTRDLILGISCMAVSQNLCILSLCTSSLL